LIKYYENVSQGSNLKTCGTYDDLSFDHLPSKNKVLENIYSSYYDFDKFLKSIKSGRPFIAGSFVVSKIFCTFEPNDIDLYLMDSSPNTIKEIDTNYKKLYGQYCDHIILVRTSITLNWIPFGAIKKIPKIQLILPPYKFVSQIFAGYHSDLVCIGFDPVDDEIIYGKGRFDYFAKNKIAIFTDLFSEKKHVPKVMSAYKKYKTRGFECIYLKQKEERDCKFCEDDCEISPKFSSDLDKTESFDEFISRTKKIPGFTVSENILDVYFGEVFRPIFEYGTKYVECPRCGIFTRDGFCEYCKKVEKYLMDDQLSIFKSESSKRPIKVLVTGGRCGLGEAIAMRLLEAHFSVTITTRYPNVFKNQLSKDKLDSYYNKLDGVLQMDLSDNSTMKEINELLDTSYFDIIILSAAETLHFSKEVLEDAKALDDKALDDKALDDKALDDKALDDNKEQLNGKMDWTGDFVRKNTGVWHKCLEDHTLAEITDPVNVNVVGTSILMKHFLNGVKKYRKCNKDDRKFMSLIVTYYEGTFLKKSSFHPITNATKAAIENIVWTIRREADMLDCNIICADPGWMYTEYSAGKRKGPIKISEGVTQILEPVRLLFKNSPISNGHVFSRSRLVAQNRLLFSDTVYTKDVWSKSKCGHNILVSWELGFPKLCPVCNNVPCENEID